MTICIAAESSSIETSKGTYADNGIYEEHKELSEIGIVGTDTADK